MAGDETSPSIFVHALMGKLIPSTLKIASLVNGWDVVLFIDGGSINNFIQGCLAEYLSLTVKPSLHLRVTIGNGESVGCGGQCRQVSLKLGTTDFTVDLLLLPIYGSGLGPVPFNTATYGWSLSTETTTSVYIGYPTQH